MAEKRYILGLLDLGHIEEAGQVGAQPQGPKLPVCVDLAVQISLLQVEGLLQPPCPPQLYILDIFSSLGSSHYGQEVPHPVR